MGAFGSQLLSKRSHVCCGARYLRGRGCSFGLTEMFLVGGEAVGSEARVTSRGAVLEAERAERAIVFTRSLLALVMMTSFTVRELTQTQRSNLRCTGQPLTYLKRYVVRIRVNSVGKHTRKVRPQLVR